MSDTPKIELVQGEIAVVTVRPGDRLVIMFPMQLSRAATESVLESVKQWLPDVPCMIIDGGARPAVIRATGDLDANPAA